MVVARKIRNMVKEFPTRGDALAMAAEYRYIGRDVAVRGRDLIVFALPPENKKEKRRKRRSPQHHST